MNKKEQLVFKKNFFLEKELAAKNRELEIEASLERVREKAMAMHASAELKEVVQTLFEELKHLDVNLQACLIATFDAVTSDQRSWIIHSKTNEPYSFLIPYNEQPFYQEMLKAWKEKNVNWSYILEGEAKTNWENFLFTDTEFKLLPGEVKEEMGKPEKVFFAASYYPYGAIQASSPELLSKASIDILQRFSKVFDSCYTRFLDLQKAEAQAREAQIEAALEKVRSTSLAMNHSEDLILVVRSLFDRLVELGLSFDGAGIYLFDKAKRNIDLWVASRLTEPVKVNLPYDAEIEHNRLNQDLWTTIEKGEDILNKRYSGEVKNDYYRYVGKYNKAKVPETIQEMMLDAKSWTISFATGKNSMLGLDSWFEGLTTDDDFQILKRFARVFEQAYTRFLDLQKAEAAAREAQIQLALERVRARTMAMHNSAELSEAATVLFEQLSQLGAMLWICGFCICNKDSEIVEKWVSPPDAKPMDPVYIPYTIEPFEKHAYETWKNGGEEYNDTKEGIELQKESEMLMLHPSMQKARSYLIEKGISQPTRIDRYAATYKYGYLMIVTTQPFEETMIFTRFAKVFEQTYTRFLDLQKAEAQAREAQIEAALESVRASSMAMHYSNELENVVKTLATKFTELGLSLDGALIFFFDKKTRDISLWIATNQLPDPIKVEIPNSKTIQSNLIVQDLWAAFKTGKGFMNRSYSGKVKNNYFRFVVKNNLSKIPKPIRKFEQEAKSWTFSAVAGKNSLLGIDSWHEKFITEQDYQVLIRFSNAFEQAYTRFLDLQKAEAQVREAQIEAALEKIRSRSLAMQKSDELKEVVAVLFVKLKELGLVFDGGAAIHLFDENSKNAVIWVASPEVQTPICNSLPYDEGAFTNNPIILDVWKAKDTNIDILNRRYSFEEKNKYFEYVFKYNDETILPQRIRQFIRNAPSYTATFISEKNSLLGASSWTEQLFSEENIAVLRRIARVFEQAYIRFLDLQKAEAQAREAQIEAALERVRSRTLAMQKSDELVETAAVLFKQLIHLGIEPNRLYICIIKDKKGEAEFWITDEDGSKVSLAYHAKLAENPSFKKMFNGWKEKKRSVIIDMQGKELENYFHHLTTLNVPFKSGLAQKRRIQYLAYFNKGFIGMASSDPQPAETLQLLERFAYVFNLTYTRFNDLQIAEAHALQAEHDLIEIKNARRKAEQALTELQAAQKQLIQSEKMASLGELTAGIAHEIQNPLNFVNNFSDVNKEMLEELKAERSKPNAERDESLQDDLINDVIANEEKINHHGKRADAIVKGMLQHSRKSSGQKEPTDINALCDEYLRLSYHGLRAKDKTFNATTNTNFDRSIGKIDIVAQDIGRVILNLINNAFYACAERSRSSVNEQKSKNLIPYEPAVSLSTKKSDNHVTITVSDNGNGIPQNIVDKIFQPFFTTKPTGEGTGLGLSLAYDIVKAHGGEIKVESKEGKGSEFIVQLSPNNNV
ncbi:MAG: sensor histidine kinase [Ginsengibacter sp.]